jgi:hypothetical protein
MEGESTRVFSRQVGYTDCMHYELWDLESGNLVGDFDTEAEALAVVEELRAENSAAYVEALALAQANDSGTRESMVQGTALATLAERRRTELRQRTA